MRGAETMIRLRLITAAWGDEFIDRFLGVTLRSLAAPNNLPKVAARHKVEYDLYVPPEAAQRIKSHPWFERLSDRVTFRFRLLRPRDFDSANSMSHWTIWRRAIDEATRDDVAVVLVASDHIFANGAMARWADLLEQGYLAVFSPGFQAVDESLTPEIAARFPASEPIDYALPDLHRAMLRHLHPIMVSMLRAAPRVIPHREWDLRAVAGKSVLQTVLASHPMAFWPARIRIGENFSPIEKFDRIAFEPCWFIGIEPLFKYLNLYLRPQPMDDAMLSCSGDWAEAFIDPVNVREAAHSYPYPDGAAVAVGEVRRGRLGAEFFIGQLSTSRALFRVWETLKNRGHFAAARWLAGAMVEGRLRRHVAAREPLTILVPEESVIERLPHAQQASLLADGAAMLVGAIRDHLLLGDHRLRPGQWLAEAPDGSIEALSGRRYALASAGELRITKVYSEDGFTIAVIDGVASKIITVPPRGEPVGASVKRRLKQFGNRVVRSGKDMALLATSRSPRLRSVLIHGRERLLGRPVKPQATAMIDAEAEVLYKRAIAARSLEALGELLAFHDRQFLADPSLSGGVRAYLGKVGTLTPSRQDAIDWLRGTVERAPAFFEAWLELGYASLEAGDHGAAAAAFGRAKDLTPVMSPGLGQPDQRIVAAIQWATLTAAAGNVAAALAVVDDLSTSGPLPWQSNVAHARLLLRGGRLDDALAAFERALRRVSIGGRFDGYLPRNLDQLKARLA